MTLISGPTHLIPPMAVKIVPVKSALDMREAVLKEVELSDVFIVAAAVADYRPSMSANSKIKKTVETLTLHLTRNPDILAEVSRKASPALIRVGFAAETEDLIENARIKLETKNLDLIVVNKAPEAFGERATKVWLISGSGSVTEFPPLPKEQVARRVMDVVTEILAARGS